MFVFSKLKKHPELYKSTNENISGKETERSGSLDIGAVIHIKINAYSLKLDDGIEMKKPEQ